MEKGEKVRNRFSGETGILDERYDRIPTFWYVDLIPENSGVEPEFAWGLWREENMEIVNDRNGYPAGDSGVSDLPT